jgi:hypothetical protein
MESNSGLLLKTKDLCLNAMSIGGLAASLFSQGGQQLKAAVKNN